MTEQNQKIYTAAVVGLGNIGFRYDLQSQSHQIFSHAKAYLEHPGFELVGGVDIDAQKRRDFETHAKIPAYETIDDLFQNVSAPIGCVSICTPTNRHLSTTEQLIKHPTDVIIMEKPLALSLEEARRILTLPQKECRVAVNYIRRWDPCINEIRRLIQQNFFGNPIAGNALYTKGLFNGASHFIDLFHFWFGEEEGTTAIQEKEPGLKDPMVDFVLRYPEFNIAVQAIPGQDLLLGEIDIVFQKGRFKMTESGWKVRLFQTHFLNADGNSKKVTFQEIPLPVNQDMDRYQYNAMQGIHHSLTANIGFVSDGDTAFDTLQTCVRIKDQIHQKQP